MAKLQLTFLTSDESSFKVEVDVPSNAAALAAAKQVKFWAPATTSVIGVVILALDSNGIPVNEEQPTNA